MSTSTTPAAHLARVYELLIATYGQPESVADEETIELLQKHRVDYAQGYYVGKPAPLSTALATGGWLSGLAAGH